MPFLFLLYINDFNQAIKFCKVHHFSDDSNSLHLVKSIKNLNTLVNINLKCLVNRLNANKIPLNTKTTEMVLYTDEVKIKLSSKRIYHTTSLKYLAVKIEKNLI